MNQVNHFKRSLSTTGIYAALILFAVWSLFPVFWVILASFRPNLGILSGENPFIFHATSENYRNVWSESSFTDYLLNTTIISVTATMLSVILGLVAGYGFARFQFRGNRLLSQFILSIRLAPVVAFIVPLFMMFRSLDMLDSRFTLIMVYTTFLLPFSIWLFTSYIREVPIEAEEAALVDGCSHFGVIWRVLLPQVWPAVGTVAILNFIAAWNEFLFALTLTSVDAVTLPVGITSFLGERGVQWGMITAAATLTMVIPVTLAIIINRSLVRGIAMGVGSK